MHFFDRKYVCVERVVPKIRFVPSVLFHLCTRSSQVIKVPGKSRGQCSGQSHMFVLGKLCDCTGQITCSLHRDSHVVFVPGQSRAQKCPGTVT